jgi:hypothetical protein
MSDLFNPLELSPEQIATFQVRQAEAAKLKKLAKKPKLEFTQLPYVRVMEASEIIHNIQLQVLLALVHVNFKTHKNPVNLSNATFDQLGIKIHASSKNRALKAWEETGLIAVRFQKNKSPIVTLNWLV